MKHSFLFLFTLTLILTACGEEQPLRKNTDSLPQVPDSNAFVVAILPTMDALPVYYAAEKRLFRQTERPIQVITYTATSDADTALLRKRADIAQTDLVRVAYNKKQGVNIEPVIATHGQQAVMVFGGLRIKEMKTMKKRMIGVARHTASEYWSDWATSRATLQYRDVFHPQINDLWIRESMLNEGQIDAAVLPEPFITKARVAGHTQIFISPIERPLGCFAILSSLHSDPQREAAFKEFLRAYNAATDSIRSHGKAGCLQILKSRYRLSGTETDSLALPRFQHAKAPADSIRREF